MRSPAGPAAALLLLGVLARPGLGAPLADTLGDVAGDQGNGTAVTAGHHRSHRHHHGRHHHKKHRHHVIQHPDVRLADANSSLTNATVSSTATSSTKVASVTPVVSKVAAGSQLSEAQIVARMKSLETELAGKEKAGKNITEGRLVVGGPLPIDFTKRFADGVAKAMGCSPKEIRVLETSPLAGRKHVMEVLFDAPLAVVNAVEDEAGDPESKLANGQLHSFLIARDAPQSSDSDPSAVSLTQRIYDTPQVQSVQEKGIDVDTEMPYGELEPFGREDTAQELTESSISESNEMVDQLERAEVAEEKRAIFRALTRLRGAAITSFDGIARSQTGELDGYNKLHHWRVTHPLHHLADEESDVSKWAFPDNADF